MPNSSCRLCTTSPTPPLIHPPTTHPSSRAPPPACSAGRPAAAGCPPPPAPRSGSAARWGPTRSGTPARGRHYGMMTFCAQIMSHLDMTGTAAPPWCAHHLPSPPNPRTSMLRTSMLRTSTQSRTAVVAAPGTLRTHHPPPPCLPANTLKPHYTMHLVTPPTCPASVVAASPLRSFSSSHLDAQQLIHLYHSARTLPCAPP